MIRGFDTDPRLPGPDGKPPVSIWDGEEGFLAFVAENRARDAAANPPPAPRHPLRRLLDRLVGRTGRAS